MNSPCIYQMGALFFIKTVQIRDMLEIVGVEISAFHHLIGLYIIVKNSYLKVIALL